MHSNKWEVKLDRLQHLLFECLRLDREQAGIFADTFVGLPKRTRKLMTFIVADINHTVQPKHFELPANECWFQFINPVKLRHFPSQYDSQALLYGFLAFTYTEKEFLVCTLTKSSQEANYLTSLHRINTENITQDQQELFNVIAKITYLAITDSYVFKNYERICVKTQRGTEDITLHYAPAKIALIGTRYYTIMYQNSENTSLTPGTLVKFEKSRVYNAK